jgi:hypothetical protein
MLHVIRQIETRFPRTKGRIAPIALAISASALVAEIGVLLLK